MRPRSRMGWVPAPTGARDGGWPARDSGAGHELVGAPVRHPCLPPVLNGKAGPVVRDLARLRLVPAVASRGPGGLLDRVLDLLVVLVHRFTPHVEIRKTAAHQLLDALQDVVH